MSSASNTQKPRTPTWQKVYYGLGAFSVVSVLMGVALSHEVLGIYRGSVATSAEWADRAGGYSALSRVATLANGPGNDVFENKDIPGERAKLEGYIADFEAKMVAARADVAAQPDPARRSALEAELIRADGAFHEMTAAAHAIFAAFEAGDVETAGSQMAVMDRRLADTSEALSALGYAVQDIQKAEFQAQLARADGAQAWGYALVGLVGLMVAGTLAYGAQLGRVFRAAQDEIARQRGETALLLQHIDQGMTTLSLDGALSTERSAALSRLLGVMDADQRLDEVLERADPAVAELFRMGWAMLAEDMLPYELVLDQLPSRVEREGRHLDLRYQPILERDQLQRVLLVCTDVTSEVERERAEAAQRETLALFDRISRDRLGVAEFFAEADRIARTLASGTEETAVEKRLIHTLKGNAGFYGLSSLVEVCQAVETEMEETEAPLTDAGRAQLGATWDRVRQTTRRLLGEADGQQIEIGDDDLQLMINAVLDRRPYAEIARRLEELRLEPVKRRLSRIADQTRALTERLGKGEVDVHIDDGGLRADPQRTASFWGSLIHLVRNSVDHGFEAPAEREAAGKGPVPRLELRARREGEGVLVEIQDDGRGISWERLAEKARAKGMAADRREDLVEALFADGLSTAAQVTEISGRGVGLGAVRAEVRALGGQIEVHSEPGAGALFRFRLPARALATAAAA
jgi:two-component system chemotaxis sensor kinase CheA